MSTLKHTSGLGETGKRTALKTQFSKEIAGSNPAAPTSTLYRRSHSPFWQARITYPDGTVRRLSTGLTDRDTALMKVGSMVSGQPERDGSRFADICRHYEERLNQKPRQRPIYTNYRAHIRNHILPHLGNLRAITRTDLTRFYEQISGQLTKSTINSINVVMRSLFDIAEEQGFIAPSTRLITVKDLGKSGSRRPEISLADYRRLYRAARSWAKQDYNRQILRHMILIIANSGIRPGEELRSLRWQDIEYCPDYIKLRVRSGKTGGSSVLCRVSVKRYLERLHTLTGTHETLFSNDDSTPFRGSEKLFKQLVDYAGLNPDITLYSLRHFWFSYNLVKGVPAHILAKNAGSSVAMVERFYDHSTIEAYAKSSTDWLRISKS